MHKSGENDWSGRFGDPLFFARLIVGEENAQYATQKQTKVRSMMQLIMGDDQAKPYLRQY